MASGSVHATPHILGLFERTRELLLRLSESLSDYLKVGKKSQKIGVLKIRLGVVHKLRLQDEVGRWSKNAHFLSTFIP